MRGQSGLPQGIIVAASANDPRDITITSDLGYAFDLVGPWTFDSVVLPSVDTGAGVNRVFRMIGPSGTDSLTVRESLDRNSQTAWPADGATAQLTNQLQHDRDAYLNFRVKIRAASDRTLGGGNSSGWESIGEAEDRFTNDAGRDESHHYIAARHGGLDALFDYAWYDATPPTLWPLDITYLAAPPSREPEAVVTSAPEPPSREQLSAPSTATSTPMTLPSGWNLIALPPGTDMWQPSSVYTLLPGDSDYRAVPVGEATLGYGYWAYLSPFGRFTAEGVTTIYPAPAGPSAPFHFGVGTTDGYTIHATPGTLIMLADQSGLLPARVDGAGELLTYDPTSGYQPAAELQPGQGAWALVGATGEVTVTPTSVPN